MHKLIFSAARSRCIVLTVASFFVAFVSAPNAELSLELAQLWTSLELRSAPSAPALPPHALKFCLTSSLAAEELVCCSDTVDSVPMVRREVEPGVPVAVSYDDTRLQLSVDPSASRHPLAAASTSCMPDKLRMCSQS